VITASVQLVGVYVVFASLILPALAVNAVDLWKLSKAVACSVVAVLSGIGISAAGDLPAGPVLVFTYALVAILVRLILRFKQRDIRV